MPDIVNVSSAEQAQVRDAINEMIRRLPTRITDPDLRACIRRKAEGSGKVICFSDTVEGHDSDLGYTEWVKIGPLVVWKSDDIHISLRNHSTLPAEELENTLMHEWAHSCCWDHGDDKGVPE